MYIYSLNGIYIYIYIYGIYTIYKIVSYLYVPHPFPPIWMRFSRAPF